MAIADPVLLNSFMKSFSIHAVKAVRKMANSFESDR